MNKKLYVLQKNIGLKGNKEIPNLTLKVQNDGITDKYERIIPTGQLSEEDTRHNIDVKREDEIKFHDQSGLVKNLDSVNEKEVSHGILLIWYTIRFFSFYRYGINIQIEKEQKGSQRKLIRKLIIDDSDKYVDFGDANSATNKIVTI